MWNLNRRINVVFAAIKVKRTLNTKTLTNKWKFSKIFLCWSPKTTYHQNNIYSSSSSWMGATKIYISTIVSCILCKNYLLCCWIHFAQQQWGESTPLCFLLNTHTYKEAPNKCVFKTTTTTCYVLCKSQRTFCCFYGYVAEQIVKYETLVLVI